MIREYYEMAYLCETRADYQGDAGVAPTQNMVIGKRRGDACVAQFRVQLQMFMK
jgi:hypothetical protein